VEEGVRQDKSVIKDVVQVRMQEVCTAQKSRCAVAVLGAGVICMAARR
jgi:hypothetical protein